ncbi:MAG TPA: 50S ribosomal protein L25/general stress protein Ctc [Candidatus Competibacteraceae bacterium]|nr:50S ribosomal protein L25/general stress protein Ctc [Candidatus Competibacteraceae bacterium]HRZ04638.1 50S ribosomal protein L25/general stress protein Ctc [Candidatus Competibacteraceae bacterium]HSA44940.1 50S ribosomal protein L25/general stress protein Ctc [Candidatus Competibacteraceae bacterium]
MSVKFELKAEPRSELGKGASRRLRRTGHLPAILYGGSQEPQPLTLNLLEVLNLMNKAGEAFYSHVLTLQINGTMETAVLRDMHRHPFKPTVMHIDFLRASADRQLRVHIPLHFTNESISRGVKQQGGVVSRALIDIEIACLPKDLPEFIEVDLTDLGLGNALHLSDLKLPDGVELANHIAAGSEQDVIVVSIHHAHGGEEAPSTPTTPAA